LPSQSSWFLAVDTAGRVIIRHQLRRRAVLAFFQKLPPCLIGIEACASSHHWSRELQALGHSVRLMPPAYVKPDVKRQKNDMADAEAICEAVSRANMRFVPTKTPEQQSCLMLHRTRHLLIRQQTAVINSIRVHLAEFGIVAPVGRKGVMELRHVVADPSDKRLPEVARACLSALGTQLLIAALRAAVSAAILSSLDKIHEFGQSAHGGRLSLQAESAWSTLACFRDTPKDERTRFNAKQAFRKGRDVDGTGK
jgi:transposase